MSDTYCLYTFLYFLNYLHRICITLWSGKNKPQSHGDGMGGGKTGLALGDIGVIGFEPEVC